MPQPITPEQIERIKARNAAMAKRTRELITEAATAMHGYEQVFETSQFNLPAIRQHAKMAGQPLEEKAFYHSLQRCRETRHALEAHLHRKPATAPGQAPKQYLHKL